LVAEREQYSSNTTAGMMSGRNLLLCLPLPVVTITEAYYFTMSCSISLLFVGGCIASWVVVELPSLAMPSNTVCYKGC
jgi:hypothetical protein